jgi:L-aminopeptidase/D-esterase-like protein
VLLDNKQGKKETNKHTIMGFVIKYSTDFLVAVRALQRVALATTDGITCQTSQFIHTSAPYLLIVNG